MTKILFLLVLPLSTSVLNLASGSQCDYRKSLHHFWNRSCLFRYVLMKDGDNHFPRDRCERWTCDDGDIRVTGCPKPSDYNEWGPHHDDPDKSKKWPYCC